MDELLNNAYLVVMILLMVVIVGKGVLTTITKNKRETGDKREEK